MLDWVNSCNKSYSDEIKGFNDKTLKDGIFLLNVIADVNKEIGIKKMKVPNSAISREN